jgi:hypothetical protein
MTTDPVLKGDVPVNTSVQDEFGLTEVVKSLSSALAQRISADGYTLGIEGSWGSGKSSLANLVAEDLKRFPQHHVLRFEPWLIGEKHALLTSFLGELASQIDEIEKEGVGWLHIDRWRRFRARSNVASLVRKYGARVGTLAAPIGSAAQLDSTGMTLFTAAALKIVGTITQLFGKQPSLDQLKSKIATGLRAIEVTKPGTRITVIIDDTDRLEAGEAIELLRLVRKVADFPLVAYVICFDASILAKQITNAYALESDDGRLFIEKIFQDVIHIPPQEPFALRRYLKRLLTQSFAAAMAGTPDDSDVRLRKELLFDRWCGLLIETPRDVVRLHQAVAFSWPHVPVGSDFFDFVWLQLLKLKSQDLYTWTRDYLQNIASYRDAGRPGDTEPLTEAEKLLSILKVYRWDGRVYLSGIDQFLPGLRSISIQDEKRKVFEFESGELEGFERGRRLGSPSHWRNYFAFDVPSYAIRDDEILRFRQVAKVDHKKAAEILMAALEKPHERPGHFVDVLLDRLIDNAKVISKEESSGMALAFAETMDEVAQRTSQVRLFGESEIWRKTAKLLRASPPENFMIATKRGKSINWLAHILRDQGFAHGLPAGHRAYPDNQWLKREELDLCIRVLTRRFEMVGMRSIFALPAPLDALFCWVQLGNADDVRAKFAEATKTETKLLKALGALCGWSNSSDRGVYHPLVEEYVTYFADPSEVRKKLEAIATKNRQLAPLHARAMELLELWEPARRQVVVDADVPT